MILFMSGRIGKSMNDLATTFWFTEPFNYSICYVIKVLFSNLVLSIFVSLPSRIRRRTRGSPKRTRTQSTSLEARPRRRYVPQPQDGRRVFINNMYALCVNPNISNVVFLSTPSRSGPRERSGIS